MDIYAYSVTSDRTARLSLVTKLYSPVYRIVLPNRRVRVQYIESLTRWMIQQGKFEPRGKTAIEAYKQNVYILAIVVSSKVFEKYL